MTGVRYRLDPALVERANAAAVAAGDRPLTKKQIEAVELKVGLGIGDRKVGMLMGITREGAKDHFARAQSKLARVM